jgi:hypothetical protein
MFDLSKNLSLMIFTCLALFATLNLPVNVHAALNVTSVTPQLTVSVQNQTVNLQWNIPSGVRLSGFEIERSLSPLSGYAVVLSTGRSARSASDQNVQSGEAYYYRIRAYRSGSTYRYSSYSNTEFAEMAAQQLAVYTAPVLESVQANGADYVLQWSLPETAYGMPEGGYDVFSDGIDDNLHHTGFSTTVSGLQTGTEHCFKVEARWTQASPSVFPASNTLCASTNIVDTSAPSVSISNPASGAKYTKAQTIAITANAQDNVGVSKVEFYEGSALKATDTSAPYSYSWSCQQADNGLHSFTAKAYDAAGNVNTSAAVAVSVDIQTGPAEYTAPVLESVEVSGNDFIVSWSLPESSFGLPAGGYDVFSDGVDDNLHHTISSTTVKGLSPADEHCFQVEARWTQVSPSVFPASNVICAQADATTPPSNEPPLISGPVKVFPGAQGFGANAIAGRGGKIIKVTNLNDSGPGSFREAVLTSGPRIIVFEVGGEINLKSQLLIRNPYMTIAGQTAPSPGVVLTGTGLKVETHDLLFQHIFVRHTATDGTDAFDIRTGSYPLYNIVVDHVSVSWGDDENLSFNPGPNNTLDNNVTFSNNLVAEATGTGGGHNFGTLVAAGTKNFSLITNLWMSHKERQPRFNGLVSANLVNNISYNIGASSNTAIGSSHGKNFLTFVGNIYIAGPNTPSFSAVAAASDTVAGTQVYLSDNISTGSMTNSRLSSYLVNTPPVTIAGITVLPSHLVENFVLSNVGARPGERDGSVNNGIGDPVDERLINEYRTGTGSLKTSTPSMPAIHSAKRSFQAPANPNGDDDGNGYTNIEEVLYQMALEVEGR